MHAEDITLEKDQPVAVTFSIEKSAVKPLWPGQYMPDNLIIRFKENE
jgi:hypothetical protein